MKKIFRFDDICINSNMENAITLATLIRKHVQADIWFCVSPTVHNISEQDKTSQQRVFPKILNAYSSYKVFYGIDRCGVPEIPEWITKAGHGLIHVDHRLLDFGAQELSILASCSLVSADIFVPPFNKWNKITEQICNENGIHLVKFEDGWLSCEHNKYTDKQNKWYLHHRAFTVDEFMKWLGVVK